MSFTLQAWKEKVAECLWDWRLRLQQATPESIYTLLSATALWPLVQASQGDGFTSSLVALGGVAAGVGGNLLAEQIQRWRDQAETPSEADVADWLRANITQQADLRQGLDAILEHLEVIMQAQQALPAEQQAWFVDTLQRELAQFGNAARFAAQLSGSGAMAQGQNARAVGERGILVERDVHGPVHIGDIFQQAPTPEAATSPKTARQRYLTLLGRHCQALPLAAMGGEEGADQDLTLDHIYIDLNTTTQVPREEGESRQRPRIDRALRASEKLDLLSALDATVQSTRLALLGDPGAGKSTFVRKLLAWQAAALLGQCEAPSGIPSELLPVLITLRDLAPRVAALQLDTLSDDDRHHTLAAAVLHQVLDDLERWQVGAFALELEQAFIDGHCLLVLDGLDEVPHDLRQRIRAAVAAVISRYGAQRIIVTCRVRSYVDEARLPDFQAHTLAQFEREAIRKFTHAWYNAQHALGRMDVVQAQRKADDLYQAAREASLVKLAANPMLLTTMAIIHQQETQLPRQRVCLYKRAVEVLLRRWQQAKVGEASFTDYPALEAVLTDDRRLRSVMAGLAYEAHRSRQAGQAVTDLPWAAALTFLEQEDYLGDVTLADAFLSYVDQRAGLLKGDGGAPGRPVTYSFPHRTFQEYLAGCHVVRQRNMARKVFELAGEGDFWRLVVQSGAEELLYNLWRDHELLDLVYYLCPETAPASLQAQRAVLWSGTMAALIGREAIVRDTQSPDGGEGYLRRLLSHLVTLLASALSAPERAEAGNVLGQLGDPRFRADAWYLPDDELLGFREIPAGTFQMGSDPQRDAAAHEDEQPLHELYVPRYYIARYPVTVAQFRAFVEGSGHTLAGANWLQGRPNHPVVHVDWYDALAYCTWLTARLQAGIQTGITPAPLADILHRPGGGVILPSEVEWEKAARGTDGRRYPWGDEPDPNRDNYGDTGVGTTSAVGCFPGGASPYGVEELSGNVWEWTRSLWGDYPYPTVDDARAERENPRAPENEARVLRGGVFFYHHQYARASSRNNLLSAGLRSGLVGFRVVVAGLPYADL